MSRCSTCGSDEMVSVSGPEAKALFPSGKRCAYYFGPHQRQHDVTYECIDAQGISFSCVEQADAESRFWDMVRRTGMTGRFSMVRVVTSPFSSLLNSQTRQPIHDVMVTVNAHA